MEMCYEWGNVSMANQNQLLLRLIAALLVCTLATTAAHAWSDPILVTPDSASSKHSRVVFDIEGNLHFFFINSRYHGTPADWFDVFHCKLDCYGRRLTEDVRLDTTQSYSWVYPAPIMGGDEKLHVIWSDIMPYPWQDFNGIYYSRLDLDGRIERYATRIFWQDSPGAPRLFQDYEGKLNAVWINGIDTLYYGKFDTSGQVLIPATYVYSLIDSNSIGHLYNLEACMDGLNQIHCTYRNYYGTWDEWNLGYSCISNQGQVLTSYYPLTPETPGITCSVGYIISDFENNLHLSYLFKQFGIAYQHYRKMDPGLNVIYDQIVENIPLGGSQTGYGDISLFNQDYVMLAWAHNSNETNLQYKSALYTINGTVLLYPETIFEDDNMLYPDLAVGQDNFALFDWTGSIFGSQGGGIIYSYQDQVGSVKQGTQACNINNIRLSIFPNPSNSRAFFQIQLPKGGDVHVRVIDSAGRMVYNYGEFFLQGTCDFRLEKLLSSGVYYILVGNEQETVIRPLINLK